MRGKTLIKKLGGQKQKIKTGYLFLASALIFGASIPIKKVSATVCPSLRVVFARGSGGELNNDPNYLEFKNTIEAKLKTVALDYEFIDLDYPAIGVGIDKLDVSLGAFFGAGESYEFGDSVKSGVKKLDNLINSSSCPDTKYVIGGYSQGAMVVSKALRNLNPDKIIYVATFGDPKIYLPEGKGIFPSACRGENLSDYRTYVPDCQAYKGLLGGYVPYEPEEFYGKVGTWCNKRDIFCSSHLNISDHLAYITDNLYEDASRVIFDKITKNFGLENHVSSPHDTAILIDSTGSMAKMIDKYKIEALRLAEETLVAGGRVALYDYRDLNDPYNPVLHCDFETCSLETFQTELSKITVDGGGDNPESLLSASFNVMTDLEWKYGSTKSLVILTDADFLSPDRDGMTLDEVVALSKKIDPVNFYIITTAKYGDSYSELARLTDGKVVTDFNELSLLTDYIMERYDSLPRVEEDAIPRELPKIEELKVEHDAGPEAKISFSTTGNRTLVILDDTILGTTKETSFTITGLTPESENVLTLIPLGNDLRGEEVQTELEVGFADKGDGRKNSLKSNLKEASFIIPKAPNTGVTMKKIDDNDRRKDIYKLSMDQFYGHTQQLSRITQPLPEFCK
ncbi:cutinase family protein [Candidatus Saccharibacteria bacterium]|nr:cutinase family protein [Candidatus Saccharibacteria bacterium]